MDTQVAIEIANNFLNITPFSLSENVRNAIAELIQVVENKDKVDYAITNIVSPDAPTTTNERGGSQSHVPVRFDLIDGYAMFKMAAVLHEGAEKYGANNWRLIDIDDHLNHLIMHAYAYLAGDRTDEHLSHTMCRAMFAQGVAV